MQLRVVGLGHIVANAEHLAALSPAVGDTLTAVREPGNLYDQYAVAVYNSANVKLGYLQKEAMKVYARLLDAGDTFVMTCSSIPGPAPTFWFHVDVVHTQAPPLQPTRQQLLADLAAKDATIAALNPVVLGNDDTLDEHIENYASKIKDAVVSARALFTKLVHTQALGVTEDDFFKMLSVEKLDCFPIDIPASPWCDAQPGRIQHVGLLTRMGTARWLGFDDKGKATKCRRASEQVVILQDRVAVLERDAIERDAKRARTE
jgi:hypothetical protein